MRGAFMSIEDRLQACSEDVARVSQNAEFGNPRTR